MIALCLFILALSCIKAGDIGFYESNNQGLQCHSSGLECDSPTECSSGENFMKLDPITLLGEYGPDGEFYDYTLKRGQDGEISCDGLGAYQEKCLSGSDPLIHPGTPILDLDTLTCTSSGDAHKTNINDNLVFTFDQFCRGPDFYVDPNSKSILELGTLEHPYRTIQPIFSEILEYHSHTPQNLTIHIAEGSNLFIQDSTAFVINVTKVTITSQAATSEITTTDFPVETSSQKAALHLMKNIPLDPTTVISGTIATGELSDSEEASLAQTGHTFLVFRSSFELINISVKRISSSTTSGTFVFLIYLQNRDFILSKNYNDNLDNKSKEIY